MTFLPDCNLYFFETNSSKILVCEPINKNFDAFGWTSTNKLLIEKEILKYGGILFRNFGLYSVSEFNRFVQIFSSNLLDYVYRSTPRTRLGGKIYTATEYPADRTIPMHNENAYANIWPEKIFFFSTIVATEGGETPIVDSRNVYKKLDPAIIKKFEEKKVLYIRNYRTGVDLSWQEVFQTNNKDEVEDYCKNNSILWEWDNGISELTTKQICQATLSHPQTQEKVWFNQAHLFHVSGLDNDVQKSLLEEYGENNLPRNAFYGDGAPFEEDILDHIREIYEQEKIKFKWQKGDIMLLDNVLMAHGRQPFKGERKVAVAMI
ncbi:MAG: TauD/TfdA family dioxygenase [Alphaproteobacteria bacterium]|nr:TauD/TfdA family dioxygenase [Alphaproteobacteria bacterium]